MYRVVGRRRLGFDATAETFADWVELHAQGFRAPDTIASALPSHTAGSTLKAMQAGAQPILNHHESGRLSLWNFSCMLAKRLRSRCQLSMTAAEGGSLNLSSPFLSTGFDGLGPSIFWG